MLELIHNSELALVVFEMYILNDFEPNERELFKSIRYNKEMYEKFNESQIIKGYSELVY